MYDTHWYLKFFCNYEMKLDEFRKMSPCFRDVVNGVGDRFADERLEFLDRKSTTNDASPLLQGYVRKINMHIFREHRMRRFPDRPL